MSFLFAIFVSMLIVVNAQRGSYAGGRPGSGYKDRFVPQSSTTADINNRWGDQTGSTGASTERLPYDAYGDAQIVNHWNSLPIEQRPFWIVNQAHIEAQRGTPQRPAQNAGSNAQPTNGAAQPANGNADDIINRFGPNNNNGTPNANTPSIQEVVYPSNITEDQRIQMEIAFLQDRLQALQEQQRRRQQQQQNGQQQNGQQQTQQQQQPQQQQAQQQQQQRRSNQRQRLQRANNF